MSTIPDRNGSGIPVLRCDICHEVDPSCMWDPQLGYHRCPSCHGSRQNYALMISQDRGVTWELQRTYVTHDHAVEAACSLANVMCKIVPLPVCPACKGKHVEGGACIVPTPKPGRK